MDFHDGVARSEFGHDEGDGGVLMLEGKEKKIRIAKKQAAPLDVHHPRSAMASPSSQKPSRTTPPLHLDLILPCEERRKLSLFFIFEKSLPGTKHDFLTNKAIHHYFYFY